LQKTYIWNEIQNNPEIYNNVFGIKKNNYMRIKTTSIDELTSFIKNQWRYGKGISWINKNGWWWFTNQLNKSTIWDNINNSDILYEKIFGVKRRKTKIREQISDKTTINDIIKIMKEKWYYWKWAKWMIWSEWQKNDAGKFYKRITALPVWENIKNDKELYELIFWTNKGEYFFLNNISLKEEKILISNIIKENGWYWKWTNWMIWPEWDISWAKGFYTKLVKTSLWKYMQKDINLYKEIMWSVPYKRSYYINGIELWFDSLAERRIAVILYRLWVVNQRREGENLHITTNGSSKNSIDFKIGDTFLEYHPYNPNTQKYKWWSFHWEAQRKYDNITDLNYKDRLELIVFDDNIDYFDHKSHKWKQRSDLCRSLFTIIKDTSTLFSHIPLDNRWIILDYENFKEFYNKINKELVDYDTQNTKINNTQSQDNFISDDLTWAGINSKAA
jgi:hypothetical protein